MSARERMNDGLFALAVQYYPLGKLLKSVKSQVDSDSLAATRKVVNHNLQREEERRGLGVSELTVASNKTSCAMLQQRGKHIRFQ